MHISITGGTGLVGSRLSDFLIQQGHSVGILTRSPQKYMDEASKARRYVSYDALEGEIRRSDAVVNLAGENLFDQRWSDAVKQRLMRSRISTTKAVVQAIIAAPKAQRPDVLVSASAVGYYGSQGDTELTEAQPAGDDFLAKICENWEAEAQKLKAEEAAPEVRLAIPRIGIVIDPEGGALEKMLTPFKMGVGGPLGSGKQYFPWIHAEDVSRALYFAITEEKLEGAFNVCAPNPVTMKAFASELGRVMGRPSALAVPEFALKLLVGEATSALTASLRAIPQKLLDTGYSFEYPEVHAALTHLMSEEAGAE